MKPKQEFQGLTVHEGDCLAIQDDFCFVLAQAIVEHGFEFFAILISQGIPGHQNRSGTCSRRTDLGWCHLEDFIFHGCLPLVFMISSI